MWYKTLAYNAHGVSRTSNISFLNTNNYTYPSKRILVDLDNFKISKSIENDRVNWLSTLYVTYSIPLITSSSFHRANLYIPLRMI